MNDPNPYAAPQSVASADKTVTIDRINTPEQSYTGAILSARYPFAGTIRRQLFANSVLRAGRIVRSHIEQISWRHNANVIFAVFLFNAFVMGFQAIQCLYYHVTHPTENARLVLGLILTVTSLVALYKSYAAKWPERTFTKHALRKWRLSCVGVVEPYGIRFARTAKQLPDEAELFLWSDLFVIDFDSLPKTEFDRLPEQITFLNCVTPLHRRLKKNAFEIICLDRAFFTDLAAWPALIAFLRQAYSKNELPAHLTKSIRR